MLAYLAPGQGAQTPGMLTPWVHDEESRSEIMLWSQEIDLDLLQLGTKADAEEIKDTANAQPLIVATGLLTSRKILGKISFVAGHSVGEITAAAIAGVITSLDAMKLVRLRGIEMAKAASIKPSGMAAVLGGEREVVLRAISDLGLVAANDNGGGQIVAAGELEALAQLAPEGARVRALAVAGAFHTPYMESAVKPLHNFAATLTRSNPHVGVISNKDGHVIQDGDEVLARIVGQVANPVRWDLCMEQMVKVGITGALEVAPAGTLIGLMKRATPDIEGFALKTPDDLDSAAQFIRKHGS